jgi:hypothetical protein
VVEADLDDLDDVDFIRNQDNTSVLPSATACNQPPTSFHVACPNVLLLSIQTAMALRTLNLKRRLIIRSGRSGTNGLKLEISTTDIDC